MEGEGGPVLPGDLLHLLSVELSNRLDFATLYNCIVASKVLATSGAINGLYRISHDSPFKGGGDDSLSLPEQELTVQKWSILWRTIILSSRRKTLYPYCRHLRMLDLRDLSYLLEDDKFRGRISRQFFEGDLARLNFVIETPVKTGSRARPARLDTQSIVSSVGNDITQDAPCLEALSEPIIGDILSSALLVWAPKLGNLRSLDLWDGKAFADETLRNLVHAHCPLLERLRIYQWRADDADQHLAQFISGMQGQGLTYFETLSDCGIGQETFLAINRHGKTLQTLKLALSNQSLLALGHLQGTTKLETLDIHGAAWSPDLKATQNDVFLNILSWLNSCKALVDVSMTNTASAPDLLAPVLNDGGVKLQRLQINANAKNNTMYVMKDHGDFHKALGQQKSLHSLLLHANPDPISLDEIEVLLTSLCSLHELTELNLTNISDYFTAEQVGQLIDNLPNLESLYLGGLELGDEVWDKLANLSNLKSVTFSNITTFSAGGIVDFINILGSGNQGFILSLERADYDAPLTEQEQSMIRDILAVKVEGRFHYQVARDPDLPQYTSDSSD